jgi:molybdate transport system ATP-binding protein
VLALIEQVAARGTQLVMAVHDPEDIVPSVKSVLTIVRGGRTTQARLQATGYRLQPE